MPFLDVSSILVDPVLASRFDVVRHAETVDSHGIVAVSDETFKKVIGVVTVASPNDLERLDDNQRTGRNYCVVTKFRLRATSPGYQPDTITWNGNQYVVKTVEPNTQYGAGFVQAIIGSIDHQDNPP